jgi:hypothetical protein
LSDLIGTGFPHAAVGSSVRDPCSVADPGCLSRIPDPDFYPSRIPYPKTATKERGEKICCHNFLFSHKFHKTANYFSFEVLKKKIWANFQRIIELFTQKIVTKHSKIWIWDPGSGKNLIRIPDPGVKKAPDSGSGSATLDPWHFGADPDPRIPTLTYGSADPYTDIRIRLLSSLTLKVVGNEK